MMMQLWNVGRYANQVAEAQKELVLEASR
jgi:hypothetical protein